jgi:mono/diheme cytochrome c family protein
VRRGLIFVAALLSSASLTLAPVSGQDAPTERPLDASGMPIPARQESPELAVEWRRFAGRYIFQRACTSCHGWGPAHFDPARWRSYLAEFPGNHEPDVREEYEDLTAQFSPGRMVPSLDQRTDALSSFLLAATPTASAPDSDEAWDGFPQVGDLAPDFSIVDLAGREHSPEAYRGKQRLVLVFSRAHW